MKFMCSMAQYLLFFYLADESIKKMEPNFSFINYYQNLQSNYNRNIIVGSIQIIMTLNKRLSRYIQFSKSNELNQY